MKKVLLMMLMVVLASFTAKADRVDRFLQKFDKFVAQVVAMDENALSQEQYANIEATYNEFIKDYNETFKDKMTTDQIAHFNRARGKYQKKLLTIKAKRTGAEFKGLLEGLVGSEE